ncbi:MAG: hypothetical protein COB84_04760 [Rhodobacteraceae bacterium]|nr:MAG: hypothetical protein COB84_04760 [Paracoccaceae bacterium]
MTLHQDYLTDQPKTSEDQIAYAKRLEKDGQREIYIRKALREHFGLSIDEVIVLCAKLPKARKREIINLRERFPNLTEKRFVWRIVQSMTLSKDDAKRWADKIISAEPSAQDEA